MSSLSHSSVGHKCRPIVMQLVSMFSLWQSWHHNIHSVAFILGIVEENVKMVELFGVTSISGTGKNVSLKGEIINILFCVDHVVCLI